jgi:hypothetical protein
VENRQDEKRPGTLQAFSCSGKRQITPLSTPAAAVHPPREAKCFPQHASDGHSPSERSKMLPSARRLRPFTLREKQNASLSSSATAIHPPREAKCFSQRASDGHSPSERSKMLLSARLRRLFTLREKQNASLSAPATAIHPLREAKCFSQLVSQRQPMFKRRNISSQSNPLCPKGIHQVPPQEGIPSCGTRQFLKRFHLQAHK